MEYLRWRPEHNFDDKIRVGINRHRYWKELCGLTKYSLREKAAELDEFGTMLKNGEPTRFLCLLLKMVHILDYDVLFVGKEFLLDDSLSQYIRLLGAFYMRLIGEDAIVYYYVEKLFTDYRVVKEMLRSGGSFNTTVDAIASTLLTRKEHWGLFLPRIIDREMLAQVDPLMEPKRRFWSPQMLVDDKLRKKIYQNSFWIEHCTRRVVEKLKETTFQLDHFGGSFGKGEPTPFLCLLWALLATQPTREKVYSLFINQNKSVYALVLGLFYSRIMSDDADVYRDLEPLYMDIREVKQKSHDGDVVMQMMDVVDYLLRKDSFCDLLLPPISAREELEDKGLLEPPKSFYE